jgi:hypothetical protein
MKVSLELIPEQPVAQLVEAAQTADDLGYYACYSADEIYHKDAWLLLGAAAARTDRIRLGPCLSPIYLRDPTHVAQLAATLDELSGGRAEVVLGIGNLATLDQYAIAWQATRPIARLREADAVIRTRLDQGSIDFHGDFFRYTGVTTAARPAQDHVPLKLGAMGGPKSMELGPRDRRWPPCRLRVLASGAAVCRGSRRRRRRPGPARCQPPRLGRLVVGGDRGRRRGRTAGGPDPRLVLHPVDAAGAARAARHRAREELHEHRAA